MRKATTAAVMLAALLLCAPTATSAPPKPTPKAELRDDHARGASLLQHVWAGAVSHHADRGVAG